MIQYYLYAAWPLWLPIMSIPLVGNISLCSVETLECFPDPTVLHVSELLRGTKKWQQAVSMKLSTLTAREHTRAGNSGLASHSYPTHCIGQLKELRHLLIESTLYITRIQFPWCLWSYWWLKCCVCITKCTNQMQHYGSLAAAENSQVSVVC